MRKYSELSDVEQYTVWVKIQIAMIILFIIIGIALLIWADKYNVLTEFIGRRIG